MPYQLYLTYSFDWNISDLGYTFSGPTHELSLNMYLGIFHVVKEEKGEVIGGHML